VGTLALANGITFNSGSTLGADVANNTTDLLSVTGNASLAGTLALNASGSQTLGKYQLLTTTGTVSGTFGTVSGTPANYRVGYASSEVDLIHLATVSLAANPTYNNINVRTGTNTIGVTIANSAPVNSDAATYTLAAAGVTGLAGGTRAADAGAGSDSSTGTYTAVAGINSKSVSITNAGANSWTNSPAAVTVTQTAYDYAQANYTGTTLAFGNVHQGASVSNQTVAFGNQTVTDASYQDLLDVSATTGNTSVTATGFTGLAASAGGATTNNLSFSVSSATLGSLASTASLTLTSNHNSVSGLSDGTATVVGSPGSITTTGLVYSGLGVWNTNGSGSWGTLTGSGANTFGANWGANQGSPGLDTNFTNTDTATFDNTALSAGSSATVSLDGANPSLKSITFNTAGGGYTIAQGSGGALTMENSGAANATITDTNGSHTISAGVILASDTTVDVANSLDSLTVSGGINGIKGLVKTGAGTLNVQGVNGYSGATDVNGGTFLANGTLSGTGAITVNNGGTLGGAGFISNANVTLASTGAKLSAGSAPNAIGTLTLTSGNLDISTGVAATNSQSLKFDLNSTAMGGSDLVALTNGTLSIGMGVLELDDFVFATGGSFGAGIYTLFTTSHDITASGGYLGANLTGLVDGYNAVLGFSNFNHDIILTVTAVPEPATYGALAGLALTGLSLTSVIRRRSKRATA
jgi:hypothetical protein